MSEPTIVWKMGKWQVEQHSNGLLVRKINVFGAAVETLGPYTGAHARKLAVTEAKKRYARDE